MFIGYARVSKSDGSQVLDLQKDALKEAGVTEGRIYEDLASGRKDDRPGLKACLKALQPGNTLVIWKLDRLGRDLKHLIHLVEDLKNNNIGLRVLAGSGAHIDTTTPNGKMVFGRNLNETSLLKGQRRGLQQLGRGAEKVVVPVRWTKQH
jgi:DNA invertase Pin-like site-specific DNA recombinase